jgi:phage terminase large subunit GpA-like protein
MTSTLEQHRIDLEGAIVPRPRSMLEFASESIVIPDGPYAGTSWNPDRQPAQRLFFQEVDSGRWRRFAVVGPTQTGKTLACFVTPLLYHLFEKNQTTAAGVPHQDIAFDKWTQDIKPAIEAGPFADLIMDSGPGSRGGRFTAVKFRNGAILRFMGAGGSDKTRSGFTAPVLAATEVDGYDEVSKTSREADKVSQMEGRTRAYGDHARTYLECTVSIETGRIWQEYIKGSHARILIPCPECGAWITLERENLIGWQDASSEIDAERNAAWQCGVCRRTFDDEARGAAHRRAVLAHEGQTVDRHGNIIGAYPDTRTLGFRWSAGNNLFLSAGFMAGEEWRAERAADKDTANRKLCQQSWTIPPPIVKDFDEAITPEDVEARSNYVPRGLVPAWAQLVTVGVDCHKYQHYYVATAWALNGDGQVIDYGVVDTHAKQLGEERGIDNGLERVYDLTSNGWVFDGGGMMQLTAAGVDSGGPAWNRIVYSFCKRHPRFIPTKGEGISQVESHRHYSQPRSTGNVVIKIGDQYDWVRLKYPRGTNLLRFNTDHFKTWIHTRLQTPDCEPGTMRIFGRPEEHKTFSQHLAAEQEVIDKDTGLPRWVAISRANHYLDAFILSAVVARTKGVAAAPVPRDGDGLPLEVREQIAKQCKSTPTTNKPPRPPRMGGKIRSKY